MKRVLAVLTALVMLFAMTACGAKETINLVGTWEGEIDYAGVVNSFVSENEVLSVSGATLDSAPVKVTYTFGEDGTASCTLDRQQFYAGLSVMLREILTPVIAAIGGGMTLEEYMATSKMSEEELLFSLFTEELVNRMENVLSFTGTYTLQHDELSVTANGDTSLTKVSVKRDTLTLEVPVGATIDNDIRKAAVQALFPLNLKKVG